MRVEHAEQMQRVRVSGLNAQDFLIMGSRFGRPVGAMVRNCGGQGVVDGMLGQDGSSLVAVLPGRTLSLPPTHVSLSILPGQGARRGRAAFYGRDRAAPVVASKTVMRSARNPTPSTPAVNP